MSLYDAVAELPLEVEDYDLDVSSLEVSSGFTRKTTTIRLSGAARRASARTSRTKRASTTRSSSAVPCCRSRARGRSTRSRAISPTQPLFETPPERPVYVDYRRWAFESAALDLALRQNGTTLGQAVGRELRPLTYVVSMRLGEPPTLERLQGWLDLYPGLRFKLDATSDWTDELVAELGELGCCRLGRLQGALHRNGRRPGRRPRSTGA